MKKISDRASHSRDFQKSELVEVTVRLSIDEVRALDECRFQLRRKGKSSSLDDAVKAAIALLSPEKKWKRSLKKVYTLPEITGQKVIGYLLRVGREAFGEECSIRQLADHIHALTGKYNMGAVNQAERAGKRDAKSIRFFNRQYVSDVLPILGFPFSIEEIERIGRGELFSSSQVTVSISDLIQTVQVSMGEKNFRIRYLELGLTDKQVEFARQGFIKSDSSAALATLLNISQEQCLAMSIAQLHKQFVKEAQEAIDEVEKLRAE